MAAQEGTAGSSSARVDDDWVWRLRAACRDADTALFFAPNFFETRSAKRARESDAKAICARCEVRGRCLEYALRFAEEHGVWGGLNESERRALRRRRGSWTAPAS